MVSSDTGIIWDLAGYKIDINGEAGNVFVVIGKIESFICRSYTKEQSLNFRARVTGQNMDKLGINWTYNDVLDQCIALTGIQFFSEKDLKELVDKELYTIIKPRGEL